MDPDLDRCARFGFDDDRFEDRGGNGGQDAPCQFSIAHTQMIDESASCVG